MNILQSHFLGSISSHETKYAFYDYASSEYSLKISGAGDCIVNPVTAKFGVADTNKSSTILVFRDKDDQIRAHTSLNEDFIRKDNDDPMPYVRWANVKMCTIDNNSNRQLK